MTEFDGLLSSPDVRTGYITRATFTNKKVTYSVVNGLAMFEGCICLGRVEDLEHQKVLIEAGLAPEIERGIARTGQQYRWPNASMPYEIDAALPNKNRVTDAIAHWTANTNMRFVLRTSSNASQYPNYVYFTKAGGCWSQVGMEGGKQTISLDDVENYVLPRK